MATPFPNKWAILIGPSEYAHVKSLKYATRDVVAVGDALHKYLDFPEDHVFRFGSGLPWKPVRDEIYHQIGELRGGGKIQPDDLLLFYFSGHGFKEKKDYLLTADATLHALSKTGIPVEDMVEELTGTGCKNVVMMIDACREEIGSKGGLSFGDSSKAVLESAGIVTLYSCEPNALSYEIDDLQHGAFTHCFLGAVQSGKCTTAKDMYDYLVQELPPTNTKYKKPPQMPYPVIMGDKWQLPIFAGIAQLQRSTQGLQAMLDLLGDMYVRGDFQDRYYDSAVELLGTLFDREPAGNEARKRQLIEALCSGKLKMRAFTVGWDAIERQMLKGEMGSQIKIQLEPLQ